MSNSNSKMIVFASIVGAILATGLLALNPSPMIKNANAQMYEDQYEYYDNNNKNYYQDDYQHGYDDDTYYNQDYNDYGYDDSPKYELEFADKYGDNYHKDYSKHPTKDHKFVCKTGQFEGFFVKSPMVCNLEIPEGPEGPQGLPGADGEDGAQGPAGPSTINTTNIYTAAGIFSTNPGAGAIFATANCDAGDTAISGGFQIAFETVITSSGPMSTETGWRAGGLTSAGGGQLRADVVCFDNPPLRP